MKALAIRLEEEQHTQLGMIAQLEELTVTDAIRQAIDQWIEARRSNPQLQARAEAVLADIDRDAATRRDAIATLLGTPAPASAPVKRRGGTGGSKGPQAALGKEEPTNTGYL